MPDNNIVGAPSAAQATRTRDVITGAPPAALKVHSSKRAEDREAAHAVAAR
jgi:hypothetical protein